MPALGVHDEHLTVEVKKGIEGRITGQCHNI